MYGSMVRLNIADVLESEQACTDMSETRQPVTVTMSVSLPVVAASPRHLTLQMSRVQQPHSLTMTGGAGRACNA